MTQPAWPAPPQLASRLAGSPLLVLLDVDGTLAPIAPTPREARVPERTRRVLDALARRPGVHVAVVSGRAAAEAREMVGVNGMWVIGNHGLERVDPTGVASVNPAVAPHQRAVAASVSEAATASARMPGVLVEDKTLTASVHYRLADPAIVAELREVVRTIAVRHHLRLTEGKKVFELRPPVEVNKGTAIVDLMRSLDPDGRGAALFAGDDRTDEDAFQLVRVLRPRDVTVHVGADARTHAEFAVGGTEALCELLEWVLAQH